MKVALTGGSGFIAGRFMRQYGDQLDILPLDMYGFANPQVKGTVETDYSVEQLVEILGGCDAIIHLAYAKATPENEKRGLSAFYSSMQTTENLLNAAKAVGISNIVFTSSRCVYGTYTDDRFCEDDPLQPINYYGISKACMEQLCAFYNRRFGMKAKVLRFGQILGPNMNDRSLFNVFLGNARAGLPLKLIGSNVRDYLYINDACKALYDAVVHPECAGIYNISLGFGTDNAQIAESMIRVLGSASQIVREQAAPGGAPDRIIQNCDKARRELGFFCDFDSIDKMVGDIAAAAD